MDLRKLDGATPPPADPVKDATSQSFIADVIEASQTRPVLVDFWADWCNPCKTLTPQLEKAVRALQGRVLLVKINADREPALTQQLRIQSLPTVMAFFGGRPVDGFAGALPESEIKRFLDRLLGLAGDQADQGADIDAALDQADEQFAAGAPEQAALIYQQVFEYDAANVRALAGLARCALAAGDLDAARQWLAEVPEAARTHQAVTAVEAGIALAEQAASAGDPAALEAKVSANPADLQARYELAQALIARGAREAAADALLASISRDRNWNEGAAKGLLLQLFDAAGQTDPFTNQYRRKLSSILFS